MLKCFYTSTKQVPHYSEIGCVIFERSWDAMFVNYGYNLMKVFKDGTSIRFGGCTSNIAYLGMAGGTLAYWNYFDGRPIKCCPFTAQPIYTSPLSSYSFNLSMMYAGDFIDVERGLVFHIDGYGAGRYAKVYNLTTGALIKTVMVSNSGGMYTYHYAGNGRLCAISTSGVVSLYDYVGDTIIQSSNLGISVKAATYDCNYNIILAITTNGYVKVYGLTDDGDGLSAPTFLPTGNKYLYSGYKLTTRLLGSGSTPIANVWINWEVVGFKGVLEKPYSITDKNGYAYNYYWCPTDVSLVGTETIRVWCEG
jgi:hypothetical protein